MTKALVINPHNATVEEFTLDPTNFRQKLTEIFENAPIIELGGGEFTQFMKMPSNDPTIPRQGPHHSPSQVQGTVVLVGQELPNGEFGELPFTLEQIRKGVSFTKLSSDDRLQFAYYNVASDNEFIQHIFDHKKHEGAIEEFKGDDRWMPRDELVMWQETAENAAKTSAEVQQLLAAKKVAHRTTRH
jgi:hypothetical protein